MASALLVCHRRGSVARIDDAEIRRIAVRLSPDNLRPARAEIVRDGAVVAAVLRGGPAVGRKGASMRLGVLASGDRDWANPGAPAPDGSYALYRVGPDTVELVADAGASRTIWYAITDDLFVASSSQRAIVSILGAFRPNRTACAWMISSGTLGPGLGWDERLWLVGPGERVALDRNTWRLRTDAARIDVTGKRRTDDVPRRKRVLAAAVEDTAATLDLDYSKWILPLSGGVDSRGVLLALSRCGARASGVRCLTWGARGAPDDERGDAGVAARVAEHVGVEHEFFPIEPTGESADRLLTRFLTAGEGRVAALSGYLDGFRLWSRLNEQGVAGIIRGDEAFGWRAVSGERDVREKVRLTMLDDVGESPAPFELPAQRIPHGLSRRAGETLAAWRDRLYQEFRLPCLLSGLTDLKTPYVEVVNPLLYTTLLREARQIPEDLRTDKKLWRQVVESWLPDVPFARRIAITPLADALAGSSLLELFLDEVRSKRAADVLGRRGLESVGRRLEARRRRQGARAKLDVALAAARRAARRPPRRLDAAVLGFRAAIVSRMCALLREDARAVRAAPRPAAATDTGT